MKLNLLLFIVLPGIAIFVVVVLSTFVFGIFFQYLVSDLKMQTSSKVEASLDEISRSMFERYSDMLILTNTAHPIMSSNNIKNKLNLLHTYEQSAKIYQSFSIYDHDGKKILDTRNIGINNTASNEEFFNTAMKGKIYQDSTPIYSTELNQYLIRFSGPVYDQDKNITGVLVANTSILSINNIINLHFQKSQVDIISKDGVIIFSNHDRASLFTQVDYPILQKNQYEYDHFFVFTDVQKPYLDYPSLQWTLLVKIPKDEFFRELSMQQILFALISSIVIMGVILFSIWFSRTISRPIFDLRNAAIQVQNGNYVEVKKEGTDEIKELASAFNLMSKSIKNYTHRLEELNIIVDAATEVSITDADGKITYVNDKFCETSKHIRSDLIGNNHRILKSGFHDAEFYKNMWNTIKTGNVWFGEIKNINGDGDYYWVKTTIMPFRDDSGKIYQFMSLRTDITEIYKSREKINDQLLQLKETTKQKDEFLSMISHELKSPIFPIIGYCDLLRDPALSKNFTTLHFEAIDEINSNAERLQRITEDLLDVSRIHVKKLRYNIQKFSLATFMTHVTKEYSYLMKEKQLQFDVTPVEDQIIESDEQRLVQVIGNLIRNAVDFVPSGTGLIEVGVKPQKDDVLFYVKDNGIGISKEKQINLFTPFYQVDTSVTRNHGGAGLGLAICKGIIENLGGKIWIESEVGKGTTFYFSIPLKSIEKKLD